MSHLLLRQTPERHLKSTRDLVHYLYTGKQQLCGSMQSGGNAIPLGSCKPSGLGPTPADNTDDSDSDGDTDTPLPGELESDEEDAAEVDSGSDTSRLHLSTGGLDDQDSMSDASSFSQGSDSQEGASLPAEQQPAANTHQAPARVTTGQQQMRPLREQAPRPGPETSNDDSDEEDAANDANRRSSHQVSHVDPTHHVTAVIGCYAMLVLHPLHIDVLDVLSSPLVFDIW